MIKRDSEHLGEAPHDPGTTSPSQSKAVLRKCVAGVCFFLALLGYLMLIKTEIRKWFLMQGEATAANTGLFWISFGWAVLFSFIGAKTWPKKDRGSKSNSA